MSFTVTFSTNQCAVWSSQVTDVVLKSFGNKLRPQRSYLKPSFEVFGSVGQMTEPSTEIRKGI